ncbi:hypothetical protein KI387_023098, partial [Taxus chinensis]
IFGLFIKLSVASGVMLCLELWYQKIVVLMAVKLKDTDVAVDSFSICLNINSWEMAIPLGSLVSNSVRFANELGAGRPREAKFAVAVSIITSTVIGMDLLILILAIRSDFATVFTN